MKTPPVAPAALPPRGGAAGGPAEPDPRLPLGGSRVDARALSKLRWRCRRGLLENDLFIERFFKHHDDALTVEMAAGLEDLMALADNDLLDLFLRRKAPHEVAELSDSPAVREVLAMICSAPIVRPTAGASAALAN